MKRRIKFKMDKKKIEELRKRLDELEGKKENDQEKKVEQGNLGVQFEEMGKSFQGIRENFPHIVVGKKDNNGKQKQARSYDPTMEKYRKVLFWILTVLVGGGALILIVTRIVKRFLF